MDLLPECSIGETSTGLEDIREGVGVREEAQFEHVDVEMEGGLEETILGVGLEHGIAEDEVGLGDGRKEAGGIMGGAEVGTDGNELGDEEGVVVEGSVEELGMDLLEVVEIEIGSVIEKERNGLVIFRRWNRKRRRRR